MLDIEDVSISFGEEQAAVSEVSMHIQEKEKMVIIGETGSGKSVLLLGILKLLPDSADVKGHIRFQGESLLNKKKKEMQKVRGTQISYIPQGSGNGLNPLYPVGKQIIESIRRKDKTIGKQDAKARMLRLLSEFGFDDVRKIAGSYPFMLSGGMRQRALIVMGIAADASLVLADEPTKGLDTERIAMVIDAFSKLQDKTLLCVTHDLRFAKAVASRITVMYASEQMESCEKEEFFEHPLHPYSQAMLKALPENGLFANMGFAPPKSGEILRKGCHFKERCPYYREKCSQEKPPFVTMGDRKVRCWKYADEA